MIVLDGFDVPASCRGGVLAIGNFDGVHRGHQQMLKVLVERAKTHRVPAVVFTFDPPPVELLRPEAVPPRLTTLRTKAELLERQGVDFLIAYPTNRELLNLGPEEFFEQIVIKQLAARGMVEGPNFYFGKHRQGDVKLLAQFCRAKGLDLDIIEPEVAGEEWISSSTIRGLIAEGELSRAVQMLGHPYRIEGLVIPGKERGRELGFPTANLGGIPTLLPADGVYAGRGWVQDKLYPAAVHVGPNPTFGEGTRKVEVHLLDHSSDLYGQSLKVDLVARIRGTQVFPSAEALKAQIETDLAEVRRLANSESDR
jgi:riboflavin kinase/FMN adenylyltransferase